MTTIEIPPQASAWELALILGAVDAVRLGKINGRWVYARRIQRKAA